MEAFRTIFSWLNPLDPLYDTLAEKLNFPVDQVSSSQHHSPCLKNLACHQSIQLCLHIVLSHPPQIRYIILLFLSYPLAYILRHPLHPSRTSLTLRYVYSLSIGLYFGFSCFGVQMVILFGIATVAYLMLLFLPPTVVQR